MSLLVLLLLVVAICIALGGGGYFYQNRYGRQMDSNGTPIMQPMTPVNNGMGIVPIILIVLVLLLLLGGGFGFHRFIY